jgi:GAF domain-containing protein
MMLDGEPILLGHTSMSFLDFARGADAVVLNDLAWVLYTYQTAQTAYAPARRLVGFIWLLSVLVVVLAGGAGYVISRWLADPVAHLVQFSRQVRSGDVVSQAWVYPNHEAGLLAETFNALLGTREKLRSQLSQREASEEEERRRRQRDLELNTAVGDLISVSEDVETLVMRLVDLVRDHYTLYFVGLYLLDDTEQYAVLHAGTGEAGRMLLGRGHRVPVGGTAGVGGVMAEGRVQVEVNLAALSNRADVDLLPYARSQVVVPLRSRGTTLGVVAAQSYQSDTFDEDLVMMLQIIADQVAVAIDGIRLYQETQEAAMRLDRAYGTLTRDAWQEALRTQSGYGYEARPTRVEPLSASTPDHWSAEMQQAWLEGDVVTSATTDEFDVEAYHMALPIRSRGEVIGVLDVSKLVQAGAWTSIERDQLSSLVDQLGQALENARLYEVTQQRALEEQAVGDVTQRMRETLNVDAVLQTAVRELQSLLALETVEIRVGPDGAAEPSRSVIDYD